MWKPQFDIKTFLWSHLSIYDRLILIQYAWQSKLTINPIKQPLSSLLSAQLLVIHSAFCLITFSYCKPLIWVESYSIWLSVSDDLKISSCHTIHRGVFWCSSWQDLTFSGHLEPLAVRSTLKLTVSVSTIQGTLNWFANTWKGQPWYNSSETGLCFFLITSLTLLWRVYSFATAAITKQHKVA